MSRLAELLRRRGITQRALADAVGVSQVAVHFWIHGYRSPRPENRRRLAAALGVSETQVDRLLTESA